MDKVREKVVVAEIPQMSIHFNRDTIGGDCWCGLKMFSVCERGLIFKSIHFETSSKRRNTHYVLLSWMQIENLQKEFQISNNK